MLDFLHDLDLGVFSQIALIECTTDGDLEYFLDMASIFFLSMSHHPAWYKFFFCFYFFLYCY